MKSFAQVISWTVAYFLFIFISVCSAQQQLSDVEQKTLREEAAKLAKEIGVSENQMYQNLALLHLAKQSQRAAQNADNPIETEHQNLRRNLYESMANALLKTAYLGQKGRQLIADLQKEQAATGGKVVSPELSRRLNTFGNAVVDALLTAATMSRQMVELASFEAVQGCKIRKQAVPCSQELARAVHQIETAVTLLEQSVKPFMGAAILGGTKNFTY